jgi:hypothetical protein
MACLLKLQSFFCFEKNGNNAGKITYNEIVRSNALELPAEGDDPKS